MKVTTWRCRGFADRPELEHTHWEVVVYADDGHPFVTTDEVANQWFDGVSGREIWGAVTFTLDHAAGRVINAVRLN